MTKFEERNFEMHISQLVKKMFDAPPPFLAALAKNVFLNFFDCTEIFTFKFESPIINN